MSVKEVSCALVVVALTWAAQAVPSHAQAPLVNTFGGPNGFGTEHLSPNDDGSSAAIDITSAFPGGLNFFGTTQTQAFVNTNGNITFSRALGTFTPNAFPVASQPMIAPFWADVDIRGAAYPAANEVTWILRPGQFVITWNNVGYYSSHDDRKMSFQLIISNSMSCGGGDFEVEFRFNRCEWETGDASGGSGGFGGTPAQAGFDAGNSVDFVEIMGSRTAGISTFLCTNSNVGTAGVWQFSVRSGAVMCPGSGEPCDTGMPGLCAAGITQCIGDGIECIPATSPSSEICDGLDNNCDGVLDDGDLCEDLLVCAAGACVSPCFEGGCFEGQTCTDDGYCVDTSCADISCGATERCVDGACVDACSGVVCPHEQQCLGGSCIAACDIISCASGSVCIDGECQCPCPGAACSDGETCGADGFCVSVGCDLTICDPGFYCVAGACLDACDGATCPTGQQCEMGECVVRAGMDAGPMDPDAGVMADAGARSDAGAATMDVGTVGMDAGRNRRMAASPAGCSCRVEGRADLGGPGGLLAFGLCSFLFWRRRR